MEATQPLSDSLRAGLPLDAQTYSDQVAGVQRRDRRNHLLHLWDKLEPIYEAASPDDVRRMKRSQETGAWLTATPHVLNGTVLSAEEFRDNLRLRFGLDPLHLPDRCDGCSQPFTVEHAMQCRQGGLILQRHNDVAGEWHMLCAEALKPSAVTDEPRIPTYQPAPAPGARQRGDPPPPRDLRGDIAVHGFWRRGTTAVFDIRVTDTDCASYRQRDPSSVLHSQEEAKKRRYGEPCRQANRHFTPLVYSVDGMEAPEAQAARKRLASMLSAKWGRHYSQVCGLVRSRLAFALARATSRCLRGTRDARLKFNRPLDWISHSGIRVYSY